MINYLCNPVQAEDDGDFLWNVFEVQTKQIINSFYFHEDAMSYTKFLENGGAFDGLTPAFMLNKINFQTDINSEFISQFEV